MDVSKVVLRKVPKNEIVVREVKGTDELIDNAPKKPTVQPPPYVGPPQVVLLITKVCSRFNLVCLLIDGVGGLRVAERRHYNHPVHDSWCFGANRKGESSEQVQTHRDVQ
jgi:hypothetical protein